MTRTGWHGDSTVARRVLRRPRVALLFAACLLPQIGSAVANASEWHNNVRAVLRTIRDGTHTLGVGTDAASAIRARACAVQRHVDANRDEYRSSSRSQLAVGGTPDPSTGRHYGLAVGEMGMHHLGIAFARTTEPIHAGHGWVIDLLPARIEARAWTATGRRLVLAHDFSAVSRAVDLDEQLAGLRRFVDNIVPSFSIPLLGGPPDTVVERWLVYTRRRPKRRSAGRMCNSSGCLGRRTR